ncbi:hypothetical protein PVAND_009969 [Polypedilum vanderplanki]|uniref:3-dehydrosphinganine reductase n=1 Tax=Polypedilum vanderplanki TaxID=319348 RepID=A0A9J6CEU8_POLVA|nr:hypothetical protein PVAND_009969 [Polypedilum vanderplanki]
MIIILVIFFHIIIFQWLTRKKKNVDGKHVVVTGGSSGIGLWVAINAVRKGADVTIVARNVRILEKAVAVIKENCIRDDQKVEYYSLDLSKEHEIIEKGFNDIEAKLGDIYMLVNCAGQALCGVIEDVKPEDARFLMNLNYFGTLYPIQYVLPKMKVKKDGIIVLTSSQAGLMGIYGLGPYSAAKFALRGLAEALSMETKHLGINVTLGLPADTDTPGFANEQKSKPKITQEICSGGGLFKPEDVGKKLFEDALKGNFFSILGFESWILSILCVGMSPWKNPLLGILQSYVMGALRMISFVIQWNFGRIVKKYYQPKEKTN